MTLLDRYQTAPDAPGTMPTPEWFAALLRGVDGPLGTVLDVGCAEGVMCQLAIEAGAESVLGIGLHDDRMIAALEVASRHPGITIREQEARTFQPGEGFDTVVYSMMAHWLGPVPTKRFALTARRNLLVIFRAANDHYAIPENGTWFPTLAEMDRTVGGVRTSETLLMTQDHGKEIWAATYRTDITIETDAEGTFVWKRGRDPVPLRYGRDLHGDEPFRPTHGAPLATLTPAEVVAVVVLVRKVASRSLASGWYPSDFSPRNVIVGPEGAWLVDDEPSERRPGPIVAPEYLPIWRATLSTIGLDFTGDLRELL